MQIPCDVMYPFSATAVTDKFIKMFEDHYAFNHYCIEPAQAVSSRYDASVFLIGSSISVLKPYLRNNNIPRNGISIVQPAIRTQQLKNLYREDGYFSEWASYFIGLGTLVNYAQLDKMIIDTYHYLIRLGIVENDILIRASTLDEDLVSACNNTIPHIQLETDTRPLNYYKHTYGMDSEQIRGRNLNIAIRDVRRNEFLDMGNIIVIERNGKGFALESALGLSTIIARMYGCTHTTQATPIADYFECTDYRRCKFADCVSVVSQLVVEGVYPNSSRIHGRILKKYIQGIRWLSEKLNISDVDVITIFANYIEQHYQMEKTKVQVTTDTLRMYLGFMARGNHDAI